MVKLKDITNKLFSGISTADSKKGLSVGLDELIEMRRYVSYLKADHAHKTYSSQSGDIKSVFKGRGIEMEEIRPYQFGDDVRDIEWKMTARKNVPYTKVYQEERDHQIYVWLDLSPRMLFGSIKELKSVTAAKITALLGWAALDNNDRFGCVIFDGQHSIVFKPKRDRVYLAAVLKKISEISKAALKNVTDDATLRFKSLKRLQMEAKNKANVFIISSFYDWTEDNDRELAMLAQKTRLFMINVVDPLEIHAPAAGQYMAEYQGQKLVFDSSSKAYQKNYSAYFEQIKKEKQNFCRRFKCQLIDFNLEKGYRSQLKIF